jgi:hypothetical protein
MGGYAVRSRRRYNLLSSVSCDGGATFNAGVGERARADARIILEGVKTEVF